MLSIMNCILCGYTTEDLSHFLRHKRSKRHKDNVLLSNQRKERESKYSFSCEMCNKRFPQSRDLERHRNRKTPCANTITVNGNNNTTQIASRDINTTNNTINITNNYMYTEFADLRKLSPSKDTKYQIDYIEHKVLDITSSQHLFDYFAHEIGMENRFTIEKNNDFEMEFAEHEKSRGVDYTPEIKDIDSYVIDLGLVLCKTFFRSNDIHRSMSIFREPDIGSDSGYGRWLAKHECKAFEIGVLQVLIDRCPERDHFIVRHDSIVHELSLLESEHRKVIYGFLKKLDRDRNGYNTRSIRD